MTLMPVLLPSGNSEPAGAQVIWFSFLSEPDWVQVLYLTVGCIQEPTIMPEKSDI